MKSPIIWQPDGQPYSTQFSDRYRSEGGALTQALHVFALGCGLPQAWGDQPICRVLETGFGLGMNFLTTWALWRRDPHRCSTLHYTSIEAHPVTTDDLNRNTLSLIPASRDPANAEYRPAPGKVDDSPDELALLEELPVVAGLLAGRWSTLRPGLQTWQLDDARVNLTLACGDIEPMLQQIGENTPADVRGFDAIYLDGFNPRVNPAMWSQSVIHDVARLSRPGARLATWCVAGDIRRRLRDAGYSVQRRPGLPPKRQRLEAVYRGDAPTTAKP